MLCNAMLCMYVLYIIYIIYYKRNTIYSTSVSPVRPGRQAKARPESLIETAALCGVQSVQFVVLHSLIIQPSIEQMISFLIKSIYIYNYINVCIYMHTNVYDVYIEYLYIQVKS